MEDQSADQKKRAERDAASIADAAREAERMRMDRDEQREDNRVRSSEQIQGPSVLRQSNLAD